MPRIPSEARADAASAQMRSVHERMLQHMGREEKAFLYAAVLRDDAVVIDSFGG